MKPSKFQFLNPYLVEVNFVTNPDFISGKNDDDVEMQNVFNVQVRKSKNENRANVELTLETNAENDQAPFKLKIKVASDFKWEDLSDERVESMLKMNAPALLLGYMRPIVVIIPGLFEPPIRTLRATIPENESHIFR